MYTKLSITREMSRPHFEGVPVCRCAWLHVVYVSMWGDGETVSVQKVVEGRGESRMKRRKVTVCGGMCGGWCGVGNEAAYAPK